MNKKKELDSESIQQNIIKDMIFIIRGQKVMIDKDLADLYGVETRVLLQAVKRNIKRFPDDFIFQLNSEEDEFLKSQFVISKKGRGGRRYFPYAFTEQGVAMLSSVLNSDRAIHVNINIMRTFAKLREMIESHKELKRKIEEMEGKYDKNFEVIFRALRQLFEEPIKPKNQMGFCGKE